MSFEKLSKKLSKLTDNAKELEKTSSIPFEDLLTSTFLKKYTSLDSLELFIKDSPFTDINFSNFENINELELDNYVRTISSFSTWSDFIKTACSEYVRNKLFS
uniref:Uncharacterized protein n=1 Tax=Siphoviridae sp. cti6f5 TaxID=2826430 RepID=A0A8S5MD84_9CAUD|nr:MAG TPA: hypothetical protein [Siphoviridae sp. cti6f5]